MSEHRRKPSQPQGGGRAAARRGQTGPSSGRRAAPRGATGSPSDSYESGGEEERPYTGRAEARRAAQRSSGGGRRRGADATGPGGRRGGPDGPGRARASGPVKKRFIDYPRAGKSGAGRWMPSWKLVTGTFLTFIGGLLVAAGIGYAMVGVPNPNDTALAQNNVFYWSDGSQMAATGGQTNRQIVGPEEIPKAIKNAVVSAENATFYKDSGVDPMGIARAFVNMAKGGQTQGGSTITQQYVKNTYLSQDQTITRKFKELFISIKVNSKLSKDEILAGYLNTAYYGRNAYGIQAAAQAYFGVNAKDLSTEQCVFLASVLKGPNLFNPDGGVGALASPEANTKRVQDRWTWILDREVKVGNMTQADRNKITKFPMPKKQTSSLSGQTGYLVDIAKEYVAKQAGITPEQLEKGGYRISTTFDKKKVSELEKAVKATKKSFLDTKARPTTDKDVQFGAASVDPKTGAIVALYGGEGFDKGHYSNNANTTGVPVGSTWKPIVLATAMQYGTYKTTPQVLSPMARYNGDDLLVIKDQNGDPIMGNDGKPFRQKNEGTKAWGMVTLKKAMEQSINSPFAQLGVDVGLSKTRKVAESMGILPDSFDQGNLNNVSFSLGTSTPSAIRMADAYGTFAASGSHYDPYSVTKVLKDGKPLAQFKPPAEKTAMPEKVANNVTDVLQNVVQNGTGKKVADMGFPVAGKTGTTDKNKSAWFVGYTRELSTAVTLFRSDPKTSKLESMNGTGGVPSVHGGDIPAQVWKDYMAVALKDSKHEPFPAAEPLGEILNASPSPSPSPSTTPSPSASPTPSTSPSPSLSSSPTASPTDTCGNFGWNCGNNGGTNTGTTGGATGTTSPTPTTSITNGNSRGNGNGGIFAGQNGG
ncbi:MULTISPECIES: transglycosylase domain-containing protein [Streptomyces]|uniref:transglycosylase domain-containing protein n=1 Tax=Streptomyces TaxID=1883 RepID=UPI000BD0F8DE|nr:MULTISPECIES: transglycosylase domain-containing protein [unclassified Streptomyces]QDN99463.1 penicillin-binding protein [Streptomyces sp. RLB1-9]QDO21194.1 penicillin-binding protein [Streptomyces sp. S1A1-8]QDO31318.1 penicillin-binding protein [Streptomyces sp. S1A1-3]QDO41256.1 penicillin-binding protein [Streptomyces sp. RLB3-17]SOE28991.1 Membrane carboxypeptidase (penicillin-binding protein) [Streptomyces sp. OK228]